MKKTLAWREVEWTTESVFADGKNESAYAIDKVTFVLTWATRSGQEVIGKYSSMDEAKAAAQAHYSS